MCMNSSVTLVHVCTAGKVGREFQLNAKICYIHLYNVHLCAHTYNVTVYILYRQINIKRMDILDQNLSLQVFWLTAWLRFEWKQDYSKRYDIRAFIGRGLLVAARGVCVVVHTCAWVRVCSTRTCICINYRWLEIGISLRRRRTWWRRVRWRTSPKGHRLSHSLPRRRGWWSPGCYQQTCASSKCPWLVHGWVCVSVSEYVCEWVWVCKHDCVWVCKLVCVTFLYT